jgi:DNA (cytosine-5)-methyltransferase 1
VTVAAPLSHGSNPNSNVAGRRREDDENLVTAFHMLQDPVSEEGSTPAWGKGNGQGTASIGVSTDSAVRRLTPTECCRLQGFPDDWLGTPNEKPDSPRYAALGDAVTVPVAEWIGRRILDAERTAA